MITQFISIFTYFLWPPTVMPQYKQTKIEAVAKKIVAQVNKATGWVLRG